MVTERIVGVRAKTVRTQDPARPVVECIGIRGGTVAALGSVEDVESALGTAVEWLDLRPAVVLPGLTDAHIHLLEWAVSRTRPDLSTAASMGDVLSSVAQLARDAPADAWLEFWNWEPAWYREASLRDLDEAAAGRAVSLVGRDLHTAWLSTAAMERLGVGPDRSDPPGGVLERDPAGRLTGVLRERALDWWYEGRPEPSAAERKAALEAGQVELHSLGVTGVQSVEGPDEFRVLEGMLRSGTLGLRVLHHMPQRFIDSLVSCGITSGFGNDWLRVGGIKYFTDGALGSSTAWMLEPYADGGGYGVCRLEPEELAHDVERAARAGLAATVHAIGDAAVRATLNVLESVGAEGLALPHRIEHFQCVHPEDLKRAGAAGIVASMQPSHLLTDIRLADERWGEERSRNTFPFRRLLDAGTVLAFGSDAPVVAADPREGFYGALARRDGQGYPQNGWYSEERLTAAETLEAYTLGPALAAGEAQCRGRLALGYHADLAAWDVDLLTAPVDEIREARAVATLVGGELVYRDGF